MVLRVEKGLEVSLFGLVFSVSEAMDNMCPEVADHHKCAVTVSLALARQIGLPPEAERDLVLAASLHDCGAFSLQERREILEFEGKKPREHADIGYRLLRNFQQFERPALIVRHHHRNWDDGRGSWSLGETVPLESHLLHLADRISVLTKGPADPLARGRMIREIIDRHSGSRFHPELVQAFHAAADNESFWMDALGTETEFPGRDLIGDVVLNTSELKGVVRLFRQLIDFRSRFTITHTSGVAAVAQTLARLAGLPEEETTRLSIAAGLHDLGKLSVCTEILEKERPLTRQDRAAIIGHPYYGYRILEKVPGLHEINVWANYHHERLNGRGYPFHLGGDRLSLGSRIVSVADVFTALSEERPYRRGRSGRESLAALKTMVGEGQLDPEIVGLAESHRETCDEVRHLAQERAAHSYISFREHIPA